jgi:hypothetical protein
MSPKKRSPVMPQHDGRKTRFAVPSTEREEIAKTLKMLEARLAAVDEAERKAEERRAASPRPVPKEKPPLAEDQVQKLLQIAEMSLRTYGEMVPPKEVFYVTGSQVCPHCGEEKQIATEFGFKRLKDGSVKPQSWCRRCRNSPDSHPGRSKGT